MSIDEDYLYEQYKEDKLIHDVDVDNECPYCLQEYKDCVCDEDGWAEKMEDLEKDIIGGCE